MGELEATAPRMIEPTKKLVDQAYDAIMEGKLPPEIGDPEITSRAIQERIRSAETFEEVFRQSKLPKWADYLGEPVTVAGFHFNPSAYDDRSAVYAVVEIARDSEGTFFPVQVGGQQVLVQLVKAWEQGWFPFRCKLTATKTSQGYDTYYLESA